MAEMSWAPPVRVQAREDWQKLQDCAAAVAFLRTAGNKGWRVTPEIDAVQSSLGITYVTNQPSRILSSKR